MGDRMPQIDDYTRVKRRKIMGAKDMESDSDDGGGVHLTPTAPEQVKQEPIQRNGVKEESRTAKAEPSETRYNPYLAHMDEQKDDTLGYGNGYGHGVKSSRMNGMSTTGTTIGHFPHHQTTAAMAKMAEDGPNNPYNGKPLSKQYYNILKTRRSLPVHAQRLVGI